LLVGSWWRDNSGLEVNDANAFGFNDMITIGWNLDRVLSASDGAINRDLKIKESSRCKGK
jgi:hypothetical protein